MSDERTHPFDLTDDEALLILRQRERDRHELRVVSTEAPAYVCRCSCGWAGPPRPITGSRRIRSHSDAGDDGAEHVRGAIKAVTV